MANEFVARKGLISSGSINVSGSVTASFFKGDGSQLINLPTTTVLSSSVSIDTYTFVGNGSTTNYILSQSYDVSSLFVSVEGLSQTNIQDYTLTGATLAFINAPPTSSNILVKALVNVTQNMTGSFSGSFFGIISTASFAQTASYALNAGAGAGFPFSGSAVITGSLQMVDTANRGGITGSVSGALTGTFPYNSLTSIPSGIVSGTTQITTLLPTGTVSSSTQINSGSFTGSFSGSFNGINLTATNVTASRYTGSFTGSILANNGVVSGAAQISALLPAGTVSSSAQYPGWVTSSAQVSSITASLATTGSNTFIGTETISGSLLLNADTLVFTGSMSVSGSVSVVGIITGSIQSASVATTASYVVPSGLPAGTVSASSQIDYNSIQNKLSGVVSSSTQIQPLLPAGTISSSDQYPGWVTSSTQIVWSSVNYNTDIVSSSTQAVTAIAGQTIAPSIINATGAISGASVNISGNGTVGGNLTVLGTLTATSQSIQYISSSQLNVATNKIIVNTDNSLRFGGISVVDSGSTSNSGSLYWDSVNDRWIYEDVTGGSYTSAILVAGPQNTGATGNERGLLAGRIPVASGDDHIDTAAASSSIRVDFPSRLTHVEAGLFVTGNLTANGIVTLQGIPSSSAQVKVLLPDGTVSSSAQYPGWVTSSAQINTGSFSGSFMGTISGVSSSNNILPTLDNTYNLGSPSNRWANLYTGDLVLSNEGSQGNSVDGTTGNWTIQEGEEELFILNNKTGKKYKFMLVEIK